MTLLLSLLGGARGGVPHGLTGGGCYGYQRGLLFGIIRRVVTQRIPKASLLLGCGLCEAEGLAEPLQGCMRLLKKHV